MYNNIKDDKCQVELKKEFQPKKQFNVLLSESYERISADSTCIEDVLKYIKKSSRVSECATFLEFCRTANEDFKLHKANFCRDRLCSVCCWRRTLKVYSQISRVMNVIENKYRFLFLTLTVQNVSADELSQKLDDMQNNFREVFCKNKKFKKAVKGFFRSLEITHDVDKRITAKKYKKAKRYYDDRNLHVGDINSNFDKYHPHFHCILAVDYDYFKSHNNNVYITRDEWLAMWQYAMNDYSITQVDIRTCKAKERLTRLERSEYKKLSDAVCEVAKYSVKSSDYIVKNDEALTDSTVKTLSDALFRRRLCGMGGCFKEAWNLIRNEDEKELGDGDLVNINDKLREDIFIQLYRYQWSNGCYKLFEVEDCSSGDVINLENQ